MIALVYISFYKKINIIKLKEISFQRHFSLFTILLGDFERKEMEKCKFFPMNLAPVRAVPFAGKVGQFLSTFSMCVPRHLLRNIYIYCVCVSIYITTCFLVPVTSQDRVSRSKPRRVTYTFLYLLISESTSMKYDSISIVTSNCAHDY